MYTTTFLTKAICAFGVDLLLLNAASAQEKKVAPTTQELFGQIAHTDSVFFTAYNTQNLDKIKSLFADDLEWFQDNGGLLSSQEIFQALESNFKKENKLTRTLVQGSLEIHPI